MGRGLRIAATTAALTALVAPVAHAARPATAAEAKAIRTAFLKGRTATTVERIRVSTVDRRYAAVTFTTDVPVARAAKDVKPGPVILKKGAGGKWKTVPTAPSKVKKDLKASARSDLRISGAVSASFTRAASCTVSDTFYGATLYDRANDIHFSVQVPTWQGYRMYPALAVHSLAVVSVGNGGTTPQWETGQAADAFASSGDLWIDRGWGLIEAAMSHVIDGSGDTSTLSVSGTWACG